MIRQTNLYLVVVGSTGTGCRRSTDRHIVRRIFAPTFGKCPARKPAPLNSGILHRCMAARCETKILDAAGSRKANCVVTF